MRAKSAIALALGLLSTLHLPGADNSRNQTNRVQAIERLCARLGIGEGAVVADVGCGDGPDTMVFARIVGSRGTVLAQEIDPAKLKKVIETADKRGFYQVTTVLGQSNDPRLPDGLADLIYMNRVFHHFSRPQDMLQRMWADLKPGGFLVVVDQQKGPLSDWTPMEKRETEHHWTGETTVVRLAREAGFLFHDHPDDVWHEKEPFVLIFRRPAPTEKSRPPAKAARGLDASALVRALPLPQTGSGTVIFCGLDDGRALLPALQKKLPPRARVYDLILEEWTLTRDERPAGAPAPGVEFLRTEKNDVVLPADARPVLVLFADAYHRLWDPLPLLRRLRQQMPESGVIAILDRKGPDGEPRRLAGHHRRIPSKLVVDEMKQAGFRLRQTLPARAKDRFCLLFEVAP